MNNEEWKPIENYEGFYEVSNMGRVRSLDRTIFNQNGSYDRIGKLIKQSYHNGYANIGLCINGKKKTYNIHRLVAEHFVENPNNYKTVNHIDGIKSNNKASNLEWCTQSRNNKHAIENNLRKVNIDGISKYNIANSKKVAIIKDNKILAVRNCSRYLAEYMLQENIVKNVQIETIARSIRKCANNGNSYHNFHFSFIED